MASLAESSVASVPLSKVAQLHEELLRTATHAQQPEADDQTHTSGVAASTSKDVGSTIAESANAYHTPISSPRPPPRLAASRSAPPSEMEAMIHPSPSQEAFTNLTRANSFHGYPEGDTQVMESQVYRDFTTSIAKPTTITPKKAILQVHISPNGESTYNTIMPDNTPKTCVEGDTGYIDLENAYMPSSSPGQLSTSSHVDELLDNPQTQHAAEHEFAKPAMPETPGLAGNKRNSNGEIVTSSSTTKKTPGFTQLFGGHDKAQMLSATQMFEQTQAPSSPQPNEPRSDPVVTRPSPIIHHHASLSSPVYTMTSPVRPVHSRPGTAGEPRGSYMSLAESQKRRQQIREELMSRAQYSDDVNGANLEEEVDRELERYEQAKRWRDMNEKAKQEWSKVRVSSRPNSRQTSRQNSSQQQLVTIDLITPAPQKELPIDLDALDDEMYQSDDDILLEDEPHDAHISDDEYDELGQEVLRSQPNNEDDQDEEATRDNDNVPEDADVDEAAALNSTNLDEDRADHHEGRDPRPDFATQHSAIADSQPSPHVSRRLVSRQLAGSSSIPSVIPGSQLGAETTLGRAVGVASKYSIGPGANGASRGKETDMPSSPPSEFPRLRTEISIGSDRQLTNARIIPESDLPEGSASPNQRQLNDSGERESNGLLYSTARTHASASGPSPQKNLATASPFKALASQQSKVYSQSPRTAAGVRHFADIAGAKSPTQGSAETDAEEIDVDAILSDVVTGDDQDFMELVSTPSEKRRSKRQKSSHGDSKQALATTTSNASSDVQPAPVEHDVLPESPRKHVVVDKSVAFEEPRQDRPSKGDELQASTPPVVAIDESTPDSVTKREQAGAAAASQLLSKRKSTPKKALKTYGKNGRRSGSETQRHAAPDAARSPQSKKPAQHQMRRPSVDGPEANKDTAVTIEETELLEQDTEDQSADVDETGRANAKSKGTNPTNPSIEAPNRVFALFKGQPAGYWPATFLGANEDSSTYRVKFDDGTITTLEAQHVCRLDFAIGDAVRVDLQEMRNIWHVVGFGAAASNQGELSAGTDIYGHTTIQVQPKSSRKSATDENASENDKSMVTEVPVTALYLTRTMWQSFANRLSLAALGPAQAANRSDHPSAADSPAIAEITVSRSGRILLPTTKAVDSRASHLRDESVSAPESPAALAIFSGMAFAISYGSNECEKLEVSRLICSNGGIILEQGFDELFSLPNLDDAAPTSPGKKSSTKEDSSERDSVGLQLKSEYNDIGFVALIADRHSRRAKYVQALALSLPTLSGKWIFDSLNTSKNTSKTSTLPWSKYLLPAGESSYLGGAIRSRTMPYYPASDAQLSKTVKGRDILLNDDGVLVVASKKSKTNWERRKAFAFLTLALGAAWVKRVSDLAEAKVIANNDPEKWKWVYVDGSVADASASLFVKGGTAGKKRKRGDEGVKIDDKAMWASDGKLRVVNDEFVVQSLILGALVD